MLFCNQLINNHFPHKGSWWVSLMWCQNLKKCPLRNALMTKSTLKWCYGNAMKEKSHLGFPYRKLSGINNYEGILYCYLEVKCKIGAFVQKINQFHFLCILDMLSLGNSGTTLRLIKYMYLRVRKSTFYLVPTKFKF